jgi:hypothetical protein
LDYRAHTLRRGEDSLHGGAKSGGFLDRERVSHRDGDERLVP